MWQAIINVGRFGRQIHLPPRKWKWLASLNANWVCLCEIRDTRTKIRKISPSDTYKVGVFLKRDTDYIEKL